MNTVYILYSEKHDKYYVGHTRDMSKRLIRHNEKTENKFTTKYRPWKLVLTIQVKTRSLAMAIEKYIKGRKSKKYIISLLNDKNKLNQLKERFGITGQQDC